MANLEEARVEAAEFAGFDLSAKDRGCCVSCRKPALARCHSDAGRKEFEISGLCEECFDAMFGEGTETAYDADPNDL